MTQLIGQAVELCFDQATEERLVAQWHRIGSDLESIGARPHISLAVFRPPTDPAPLIVAIEALAAELAPLPITLEAVGIFPGDACVVFLAPASSAALTAAHQTFHDLLGHIDRWDLYRPGRWVPHCTMAMGIGAESLGEVALQLASGDVFGPARLERIALVEYPPVRTLHETSLLGSSSN